MEKFRIKKLMNENENLQFIQLGIFEIYNTLAYFYENYI